MKQARFFQVRLGSRAAAGGPSASEESAAVIGETETPLLDIYETADSIVVQADLPGVDPHAIGIRLLGVQLTLEGKRCQHGEVPDAGQYVRMERCYEDFRRILQLPCAVDPEGAHASYVQGVLVLRLPKITDRRRKAIQIEIK